VLPGQDNQLLASEPEVLKRKISESNGMVKEMAKSDRRVKLLRNIPTLGPFFSAVEFGFLKTQTDDLFSGSCVASKLGRCTNSGGGIAL